MVGSQFSVRAWDVQVLDGRCRVWYCGFVRHNLPFTPTIPHNNRIAAERHLSSVGGISLLYSFPGRRQSVARCRQALT